MSLSQKHIKAQRNQLIVHLLQATGMRVGQLCKLQLSDIDTGNRTITISGRQRLLTIDLETIKIIRHYCGQVRTNQYLFPITRSMVWRIVKKACNVSPNTFRQAIAPLAVPIKRACDLRSIQLMLGQEQITHKSCLKAIYKKRHPRS